MASVARNFVLFKTDLFLFHQRNEDIDRWFVGGDCAGWFYARLLPVDRIQGSCEPVMEDWGWTFAVSVDDVKIWVNAWAFHGMEHCWLLGLEAEKRVFRRKNSEALVRAKDVVSNALENIITGEPRIAKHEWFTESPFNLNVKEF